MEASLECCANNMRLDHQRTICLPSGVNKANLVPTETVPLGDPSSDPPDFKAFRSLLHAMHVELDRFEVWSHASCRGAALDGSVDVGDDSWIPSEREEAASLDQIVFTNHSRTLSDVAPPAGCDFIATPAGASCGGIGTPICGGMKKDTDSDEGSYGHAGQPVDNRMASIDEQVPRPLASPARPNVSFKIKNQPLPLQSIAPPGSDRLSKRQGKGNRRPDEEAHFKIIDECHRWFDQLDEAQSGILSMERVVYIMKEAMDNPEVEALELVRDTAWCNAVLTRLAPHYNALLADHESASRVSRISRRSILSRRDITSDLNLYSGSQMDGISKAMFAELVLWDDISLMLEPELRHNLFEMRNALIKHSVDLQIWSCFGFKRTRQKNNTETFLQRAIEPSMGFVIFANAVTIGIAADVEWGGWSKLEIAFTVLFLLELVLKVKTRGCRQHFFGADWAWSFFDAGIVTTACFDVVVSETLASTNGDSWSGTDFTIIKLVRLTRLTRLLRVLRLLRLRIFKELLLMIKGVTAVMRTLGAAIILLLFMVYILGVLLRQTIGADKREIDDDGYVLFSSLPWAMFNVFRCFATECTSPMGKPILPYLTMLYGPTFALPYTFTFLFITFGVFNLIMAIFVENVMEAAKTKRTLTENEERCRVCRKLRELVLQICGATGNYSDLITIQPNNPVGWTTRFCTLYYAGRPLALDHEERCNESFMLCTQIPRERFSQAISQNVVKDLFDELGIYVGDLSDLFDVLDADSSGMLDVSELITGLLKLRSGGSDKSDIVAAVLGLRAVQKNLKRMVHVQDVIFETVIALGSDRARHQEELLLAL